MKQLYDKLSLKHSKAVTNLYSTSFSSGVSLLHQSLRDPIHAIYGFVRLADEIVDSFAGYDQAELLKKFESDTWEAIEKKISLNPILNSFQWAVNKYEIDEENIRLFLDSMAMDLHKLEYDKALYERYILGSAEAVGLMCLRVFCNGDSENYDNLKPHAQSLGSAFQKVNFLRDIKADVEQLGRVYFPEVSFDGFDEEAKDKIEKEVLAEFEYALEGIKKLPNGSKLGVYTAYVYYLNLLNSIMHTPASILFERRIRVSNWRKLSLMLASRTKVRLGVI